MKQSYSRNNSDFSKLNSDDIEKEHRPSVVCKNRRAMGTTTKSFSKGGLATAVWVTVFAYIGVTCRAALSTLTKQAAGSVLSTLGAGFFLPNILGSFGIGFGSTFQPHVPKRWAPLLIGFNTGFCGSCTTFATWQLIVGVYLLNGNCLDSFTLSALTFVTSYMSLLAGRQLGKSLLNSTLLWLTAVVEMKNGECKKDEWSASHDTETKDIDIGSFRSDSMKDPETGLDDKSQTDFHSLPVGDLLIAVVGFVLLTGAVWALFAWDLDRRGWWVAASFGPLGALVRYFLSLHNRRTADFPVFTFVANITAVTINIVIVLIHNSVIVDESIAITDNYQLWVRSGISTGFCGSLSTVSTWMNELCKMNTSKRLNHSYRYAIVTFLTAHVIVLAVGAPYIWISGHQLYLNPCSNCTN